MTKKIILTLFAVLFLAQLVLGQFYVLENHAIEINVDTEGNAQVTERYYLNFQNEIQLADFRQTVSEIGVSFDGWRAYDSRIYPRIGQEKDIVVSGISFVENTSSLDFLEMNYFLKSSIMEKIDETSRVIEYSLKPSAFSSFVDGALLVIPSGTTITIQLPRGVEIEPPVKPDAVVGENTVVWTGYVFGNELELNYLVFKQISSFDLDQAIQELMQSELFLIFVVIAALILIILLAKRKAIGNKVQNYVIRHSDLGGEEQE